MTSYIYMHGLNTAMMAAEDPDAAVQKIKEAEEEGEDFAYLTSHGVAEIQKPVGQTEDGKIVVVRTNRDSFTKLRIRHALVVAVREAHPGEVPDPSPLPDELED